jgi:hypothetical protein
MTLVTTKASHLRTPVGPMVLGCRRMRLGCEPRCPRLNTVRRRQ